MTDKMLGVDVSKRKFDMVLLGEDGKSRSHAFPNSEAGFRQLQGWLERLRRALYWPAIVAMRHNPTLRAFAQRLREAGKPTTVIVAALTRKLLHIAFGVLKHGRPFDPNYHPITT